MANTRRMCMAAYPSQSVLWQKYIGFDLLPEWVFYFQLWIVTPEVVAPDILNEKTKLKGLCGFRTSPDRDSFHLTVTLLSVIVPVTITFYLVSFFLRKRLPKSFSFDTLCTVMEFYTTFLKPNPIKFCLMSKNYEFFLIKAVLWKFYIFFYWQINYYCNVT